MRIVCCKNDSVTMADDGAPEGLVALLLSSGKAEANAAVGLSQTKADSAKQLHHNKLFVDKKKLPDVHTEDGVTEEEWDNTDADSEADNDAEIVNHQHVFHDTDDEQQTDNGSVHEFLGVDGEMTLCDNDKPHDVESDIAEDDEERHDVDTESDDEQRLPDGSKRYIVEFIEPRGAPA